MIHVIAAEPKLLVRIKAAGNRIEEIDLVPHDNFALAQADRFPQFLPWLEKYSLREEAPPPLELAPPELTPFSGSILRSLSKVPLGQSVSYSDLAFAAGHEGAARAAGSVCGGNPFPLFIPCHRVLAKGGGIGGFRLGLTVKRLLLDFERISYR